MNEQHIAALELASQLANLADQRKAKDILLLQTREVTTLADYFVIASVESRTQMLALAEQLIKAMKAQGLNPYGQQVDKGGRWTVLDFVDVVVHLFHQEDRAFYKLERFWNHATEIPRTRWCRDERQAS